MKNKIISGILASTFILGATLPVFASTNSIIKVKTNIAGQATSTALQKAQARGEEAITARINSLTSLTTRINAMTRISASQKTALIATIQAEISDLMNLQTQIQNATSSNIKTDLKTIAPNYRVYMLVEPEIAILAAVDRVQNIVTALQGVSTKLAARVAIASSTSATSLNASIADMNAKLSDASLQASTSQSLVINLKPDNGDQTIMKANTAALKSARAGLKTATADLMTARKDAMSVLKGLGVNASTTVDIKADMKATKDR